MRRIAIGLVIGIVLGLLASWASPVVAQAPARLFGTSTTGAAVPVQVDASGYLKVVCQ